MTRPTVFCFNMAWSWNVEKQESEILLWQWHFLLLTFPERDRYFSHVQGTRCKQTYFASGQLCEALVSLLVSSSLQKKRSARDSFETQIRVLYSENRHRSQLKVEAKIWRLKMRSMTDGTFIPKESSTASTEYTVRLDQWRETGSDWAAQS